MLKRTEIDHEQSTGDELPLLFPLSAKSKLSLKGNARRLAEYLTENMDVEIENIAFTYQIGKVSHSFRSLLRASSRSELLTKCQQLAEIDEGTIVNHGQSIGFTKKTAHLFTGQGSQYLGMGSALYSCLPVFREELNRCAAICDRFLPQPLLEVMFDLRATDHFRSPELAQPALFAFEYALSKFWSSVGYPPEVVLGHSLGEWVAACIAGAYELEEACWLVYQRGLCTRTHCKSGMMLSIGESADVVQQILHSNGLELEIAAKNAVDQTVVAGRKEGIELLSSFLSKTGTPFRALAVPYAFHSELIEPMIEPFLEVAKTIVPRELQIPMIRNEDGQVESSVLETDRWRNHSRKTVEFVKCLETIHEMKCEVILEVGPSAALTTLAKKSRDSDSLKLASITRGTDEREAILNAVSRIWENGFDFPWDKLRTPGILKRVHVPTYEFERRNYSLCSVEPTAYATETTVKVESVVKTKKLDKSAGIETITGLICDIWKDSLRLTEVHADSDFHDLGADSLDAIKLLNRTRDATNIHISIEELFSFRTARGVAALVKSKIDLDRHEEKLIIPNIGDREEFPLTAGQLRMYFLDQLMQRKGMQNIAVALPLNGPWSSAEIETAIRHLISKHQALRMTFHLDNGLPFQRIQKEYEFKLKVTDLSEIEDAQIYDDISANLTSDAEIPFNLEVGPLFFANLIKLPEGGLLLSLCIHHIIFDARSMEIFHRDLLCLLESPCQVEGEGTNLRYVDYVSWINAEIDRDNDRLSDYWDNQLSGCPSETSLPFDMAVTDKPSFQSGSIKLQLEKSDIEMLRNVCKELGLTPYIVLLSAFKVFLSGVSGHSDVVVGTPVAGRIHTAIENIVGLFVNTIPIRTKWESTALITFVDIAMLVRDAVLRGIDNQIYPLDRIVRQLKLKRLPHRPILFNVLFHLRTVSDGKRGDKADASQAFGLGRQHTEFDLTLLVEDFGTEVELEFIYSSDLFMETTMAYLQQLFISVARNLLASKQSSAAAALQWIDRKI